MKKRTIALGLRNFTYTGLYIYAQGIHDQVMSMPGVFPAPVPSLSVFQASIDAMREAVEAWGDRGSAGGEAQKAALLQAQEILRGYLKSYAQYVMTTQPDNYQSWLEVGFVLKKMPAKSSVMQSVQNLHQFIARNIPQGLIKLKWKRPLETPKSTVISYMIYRSVDNMFANAILIGTTVNKATYIDNPGKAGVLFYYWVIPYTTAGKGVLSEHCAAFASPI